MSLMTQKPRGSWFTPGHITAVIILIISSLAPVNARADSPKDISSSPGMSNAGTTKPEQAKKNLPVESKEDASLPKEDRKTMKEIKSILKTYILDNTLYSRGQAVIRIKKLANVKDAALDRTQGGMIITGHFGDGHKFDIRTEIPNTTGEFIF